MVMMQPMNGGQIKAVVVSVMLIASVGALARQSSATPISAKPGVAAGILQAGAIKITLAHAYPSGPIESGGTLYQIVLTDAPIPSDAIGKEVLYFGGQALLRVGK